MRHREPAPLSLRLDAARLLVIALFLLYVLVVLRTAWLSDDAFISFRTLDNFVHGYGLRWNVDERVQSFTHPLWLLLLAPFYALSGEPYFTPLVLSMLLAVSAVWWFTTRLASSYFAAAVGISLFAFSRAFVEYSTSGLENALTFLLLALFLQTFWHTPQRPRRLWLLAALLMLNRLDLALLVAPMLVADAMRRSWRSTGAAAIVGLVPLITWELFSIVYYGFPFPNTAYAKLQTGITARDAVAQGALYLLDAAATDPVTPLAIALGCVAGCRDSVRRHWPVVLGAMLYCAYVVRVGGDFMSGRLLTPPLFVSVGLLGHIAWRGWRATLLPMTGVVALLGIAATDNAPITSTSETFIPPQNESRVASASGITDERMYYYRYTGLLRWTRSVPLPRMGMVDEGRKLRDRHDVTVVEAAGLTGYYAGPNPHLIDVFALSDPLLARLPANAGSRVGHYRRAIPAGYAESIDRGENVIEDLAIGQLYRDLRVITSDPLWSRRRWRAILRLNF